MDKLIFINNTGTDYSLYYDKRNKRVWYLDLDGKDTEGKRHRFANFYEFPYRESVKKLVRREFHNSLTDAQKSLIPNYDNKPIGWRDIADAGLDAQYREIEDEILDKLLDVWAKKNHLSLDCENLTIN